MTITNLNATNAISNRPVGPLAPGDQFYAGDYKVTVTSITGPGSRSTGPGGWTGEGIVDVTLPKGINLPAQVTFDNAKLNDCYELAAGKLVTKYDPSWFNAKPQNIVKVSSRVLGDLHELLGCNSKFRPVFLSLK